MAWTLARDGWGWKGIQGQYQRHKTGQTYFLLWSDEYLLRTASMDFKHFKSGYDFKHLEIGYNFKHLHFRYLEAGFKPRIWFNLQQQLIHLWTPPFSNESIKSNWTANTFGSIIILVYSDIYFILNWPLVYKIMKCVSFSPLRTIISIGWIVNPSFSFLKFLKFFSQGPKSPLDPLLQLFFGVRLMLPFLCLVLPHLVSKDLTFWSFQNISRALNTSDPLLQLVLPFLKVLLVLAFFKVPLMLVFLKVLLVLAHLVSVDLQVHPPSVHRGQHRPQKSLLPLPERWKCEKSLGPNTKH